MTKRKQFTENQIWWLYPDNTLIKLLDHHPVVKENFNVQFTTLKEFFLDNISYIMNTRKYILKQINKKYPELNGYNDILVDNIQIAQIKKEDIEKNINKNIDNHIWLNHYINYSENNLAKIKWVIEFKSPLYLNIEKYISFTVYINQSSFDIFTEWQITYTVEINYWLESVNDPSWPEIDIYFTENEKLWKKTKQDMFRKLNSEIKKFLKDLNLDELLNNDYRKVETNLSDLPSYKDFKKEKELLVGQLNSWDIDSKFLYDWEWAKKFNLLTNYSDYYLPRNEINLLYKIKWKLNENVIDLWSWNWDKALNFLEATKSNYYWIDSSISMLLELSKKTNSFQEKWINKKNININFSQLDKIKEIDDKTLLLLGSTLWNFSRYEQINILGLLKETLSKNDNIILSLDLEINDKDKLIKAYSGNESKDFIFSLFKELWFNESDLELKVEYHPLTQKVETWIIIKNDIKIETEYWIIDKNKWDYIKCISSEKFNIEKIKRLLKESWLKIINQNIENNYWIFTLERNNDLIKKID